MKKRLATIILASALVFTVIAGEKPAYRIFSSSGKKSGYKEMTKEARSSDFVFFGEMHDNPICHWLELQLSKDMLGIPGKTLVMGAEMFETDNQLLLNEYVQRQIIRKKDFDAEAKLWKNYQTDYSPLLEFAKQNGIRFVATSIPRRFAALVNFKGFEGLDNILANERGLMAPLPIPYDSSVRCYREIMSAASGAPHGMGDNLAKAQAIKDATMAWFMLKNTLMDSAVFLHFNGSYHSDNHEGIVWMLKQYLKRGSAEPKIMTISCVEQTDLDSLKKENEGKADFIIVIPSDMTKTMYSDPAFSAPAKPSAVMKKETPAAKPQSKEKAQIPVSDDDNE